MAVGGIKGRIIAGLTTGVGAVGGYAAVNWLNALYTMPFGQTTNLPGTTATLGDTVQSILNATGVTIASGMLFRRSGSVMARRLAAGVVAGAWLSVVLDLVRSSNILPASISSHLSGYPRGMGAIAPGATYMPVLTAGPVFNPNARMAGYPGAHVGMSF